jgi:hypothetical protein
MHISQTNEQIKALSSLQNHCEIEAVNLQSCTAQRAKAGSASFKEPFSVKPALSNISSSIQGHQFVVDVAFEYAAWDASEPPERLFCINCAFEVIYRLNNGYQPSEEEKASFGRGTAVFNCWPYAREFLRDMTARLGHQTPALPLLRITPKKVESAEQPKVDLPKVAPSRISEAEATSKPNKT